MNNLFPDLENQPQETIEEAIPVDEQIPAAEDDYQFATGNLDDFMQDFEQHKEDMGIDVRPTPEEFNEAGKTNLPKATARKTGKFIANMTDYACATGLSLISGLDMKEHKADEESRKELEEIITEYIAESGGEIPLSVQLIICLIVTYALQIPGAIKTRRERKK